MSQNANNDQARAIFLAQNIAKVDEITRRADIIELVTILRRMTVFDQLNLVEKVQDPQALRYLGSAGLQRDARAAMINKLQSLAALGIK